LHYKIINVGVTWAFLFHIFHDIATTIATLSCNVPDNNIEGIKIRCTSELETSW
jgi:hypothetical protein